ncbi:MBL fold metallo-hydrolase [Actinotalea sp. M2MS4P-6]|uniref:MBL fold metallo-hydrolase RNA specificity domain-containing protein n=1 Tax=Actinotalea sp. M2MS4P-6 TaxID=2983762 RepID=UPI0021E3857B|nr:MBL fold metallo-hydrolase [Actinotalea sp. M2MS4P-6]MCV2394653.1 MBL fold metallo-hydrolase [Actinotalea sp. M2MS4P-6]
MHTSLRFLGAAGTVTGSKLLVDTGESRLLIDAGLFQGPRELRRRNWRPLPVPASSIDAVVLTHAHLDHSGYLPALVDQGFAGPIVTTRWTAELAAIVLRDSAHLQEEDAAFAAGHGYSRHAAPRPLYDTADAERCLPMFRPTALGDEVSPCAEVSVHLQSAGHILGSASAVVTTRGRRFVVSGDLGRPSHPLLAAPPPPPAVDAIVVESTYGDRRHAGDDLAALADVVTRTIGRGGSVLIPAFAVDRTEVLLHALRRLGSEGRIPRVPVFVDSPMALAALEVYRRALREQDPELAAGTDLEALDPGDLHEAHTASQSRGLDPPNRPSIIVSASGMATGGRVVHHLKHLLPDERNAVVLVGYQAEGTRGRSLEDGAAAIKMHGRYVPVRAEVVVLHGFSVHADAGEIVGWLAATPAPPDVVYVWHGEVRASRALARRVRDELGWHTVVPEDGERVLL